AFVGPAWFSRHLFQFYIALEERDVAREWTVRILVGCLGVVLVWIGSRVARRTRDDARALPLTALGVGAAVLGALIVSEIALRHTFALCHEDARQVRQGLMEVRIGQIDPRYGWVYVPSRTTPLFFGQRPSTFAVNAQGLRAPTQESVADPHAA